MKVTAREQPTLTCSACGLRVNGTVNGRHAEFTPPADAPDTDPGDPPLTRLHPDHTTTADNSTGHRPDIGGDATPSA